ncbi:sulfur oxidation c-type cytochrome SoxX [[Pseudomonas] carboxydohydrogena]|uniref:Sulfur oxidation c-type cytochrome SoxX n=1 Tax=Afipia carboxydohydrogena TaxID=290 RepID=A0ABY8BL30_AFICR|nr:sulfur oxidation c-type cytochrome SoxX [[Pseudomonas] carboxydohydrogena]
MHFNRLHLAIAATLVALTMPVAAYAQPTEPLDGKALALNRSKGNCITCHEFKGGDFPGSIGPALNDMKARFPDRKELTAIIEDETKRNPETVMPPFGRNLILTDKEISAIVDFLYQL